MRLEQKAVYTRTAHPPLFELRPDRRPEHQRIAAGHYREPCSGSLPESRGSMTRSRPFLLDK
jgi:hypothetical protein